jgi:hypothetical protein
LDVPLYSEILTGIFLAKGFAPPVGLLSLRGGAKDFFIDGIY